MRNVDKRGEELRKKEETSWDGIRRGTAAASAADRDGWRNFLASLKSPHGPDKD